MGALQSTMVEDYNRFALKDVRLVVFLVLKNRNPDLYKRKLLIGATLKVQIDIKVDLYHGTIQSNAEFRRREAAMSTPHALRKHDG